MPIILPKCPENNQLNKEKCRCKKKSAQKNLGRIKGYLTIFKMIKYNLNKIL